MLPKYVRKPASPSLLDKEGTGHNISQGNEKKSANHWWMRRTAEFVLALGLLVSFSLLQPLFRPDFILPPIKSKARGVLGNQTDFSNLAVGDVKWWKCDGPDVVPGVECGYIMYVFFVPKSQYFF